MTPAVIEGVRLERWMNVPSDSDPRKFRMVGVLLPVRMLKDPLSLTILSEIKRRVETHEALLEAAKEAQRLLRDKQGNWETSVLQKLNNAINAAENHEAV